MSATAEATNPAKHPAKSPGSSAVVPSKRLDWHCELCGKFGSIHHPDLKGPVLVELLNEVHSLESPECLTFPIYTLEQDGIQLSLDFLKLTEHDFKRAREAERVCPYPD